MDKELIKNNLLEYAEKAINNGYCDEFVRNNFRFSLNINRIAFLVFNNEIKSAEIGNILSIFIKELDYSQYYFKEMLFDKELKIKLIELFLFRLRFLKEKSKIEYYQKNKEKAKEYRQRNKEKLKENKREYYQSNKEIRKEYQKKYYQKNKEKFEKYQNKDQDEINKKKEEKRNVNKEIKKEYYKRNKEKLNKYRKEYYHKNIEKSKEYQKEYRRKNKEKLNKK